MKNKATLVTTGLVSAIALTSILGNATNRNDDKDQYGHRVQRDEQTTRMQVQAPSPRD